MKGKNSNDEVGYNRSKTTTRGSEWAKIYVSISNIAALLTALTAFKVGRHGLISAPGAFRKLNIWASKSNFFKKREFNAFNLILKH